MSYIIKFLKAELKGTNWDNAYDLLDKIAYTLCCQPIRGNIHPGNVLLYNKALREALELAPHKIELSVGAEDYLYKFTNDSLKPLLLKKVYSLKPR